MSHLLDAETPSVFFETEIVQSRAYSKDYLQPSICECKIVARHSELDKMKAACIKVQYSEYRLD